MTYDLTGWLGSRLLAALGLAESASQPGHPHVAANVTDFNSASRAQAEAALIAGANITITPAGSGATRTLTVAATGGGSPAGSGTEVQYRDGSSFGAAPLARMDANTMAQFNGTTAQIAQVFRTRTDASNGEWYQVTFPTAVSGTWAQIAFTGNGTGGANLNIALTPRGTGAISAHVPDGTMAGGNARGTNAVDWQTSRGAAGQVASGNLSIIGGGDSNTASGERSTVGGGSFNIASGTGSTVGGGASNTASNFISTVGGGRENIASGQMSWIPGGARGNTSGIFGAHAWSAEQRGSLGDNQHFGLPVQIETTGTTATILTSDRLSPIETNVLVLPDNGMWSGPVWVEARSTGGATAGWLFWCIFKRGAGAGTTTLVHSTTVATHVEAGLSGVTCTLVANTTRGSAEIRVVGLAATTIDWFGEFFGGRIHR